MSSYMEGFAYDTPDRWEAQANCKGKPFELFEYQEKDSPLALDMDFRQRLAFNQANSELAAEICIECPVMLTCLSTATKEEKLWTVRGGEPAARLAQDVGRYDSVGRPLATGADRVCQRGHVVKGGGRCRTCKRENNAVLQRAAREAAKNAV